MARTRGQTPEFFRVGGKAVFRRPITFTPAKILRQAWTVFQDSSGS